MTDSPIPRVWVLTDDKPGNRTQSIGVAQKLPWPYEEKNLRLNALAALPNRLLGGTRAVISTPVTAPFPDIAIAAGRRLVPALRYIKKKNPRCFIAYIMHPQASLSGFDLVAIPAHDDPPERPNVLATLGAPHAVTPEKLAAARKKWGFTLQHLPAPRIALLVGGNSASARYTAEDFHELGVQASRLAEAEGGSLLVSTSRRTGGTAADFLRLSLAADHEFHAWNETSENPYYGFLALADAVIVSGDSMSMCAEACSLGKPVYVFIPRYGKLSVKLRRFHDTLFTRNLARPLLSGVRLDWRPEAALDEASRIAAEIEKRYALASG